MQVDLLVIEMPTNAHVYLNCIAFLRPRGTCLCYVPNDNGQGWKVLERLYEFRFEQANLVDV
jgi:hypothetical protein